MNILKASEALCLILLTGILLFSSCSNTGRENVGSNESDSANSTERVTSSVSGDSDTAESTLLTPKAARKSSFVYGLRDPAVLLHDGVYYMYGTGWSCYVNRSGKLSGNNWRGPVNAVKAPADCAGDPWAPEVYEYNGLFYMFTTYKSRSTGHRGCAVFTAESPTGPFVPYSDGFVTPADWDSIDGTLYIDEEGQPWMVFVHEWTSTDDGIGRMACAKMSQDLKSFISEPTELFRADDAPWRKSHITDGCFMYKCKDGTLLMLWSNSDGYGYCVGVARSTTGLITGPWVHEDTMLYSKSIIGDYDGGHGMIFSDTAGKLWMVIHSPNSPKDGTPEMPVFIPLKEERSSLVWDLEKR